MDLATCAQYIFSAEFLLLVAATAFACGGLLCGWLVSRDPRPRA